MSSVSVLLSGAGIDALRAMLLRVTRGEPPRGVRRLGAARLADRARSRVSAADVVVGVVVVVAVGVLGLGVTRWVHWAAAAAVMLLAAQSCVHLVRERSWRRAWCMRSEVFARLRDVSDPVRRDDMMWVLARRRRLGRELMAADRALGFDPPPLPLWAQVWCSHEVEEPTFVSDRRRRLPPWSVRDRLLFDALGRVAGDAVLSAALEDHRRVHVLHAGCVLELLWRLERVPGRAGDLAVALMSGAQPLPIADAFDSACLMLGVSPPMADAGVVGCRDLREVVVSEFADLLAPERRAAFS